MKKYAQIYEDLGYHTVRFSPSNKLTFFESEQEHKKYAYEFLNKLKYEYKLTDNPILFHLFSNACGFIIYQHILNEFKTNQNSEFQFVNKNQAGLIFDSSPGLPPNQFFQFTQSVYDLIETKESSSTSKCLKEYILAAMFVVFFKGYIFFQFGNDYFSKFFRNLLNDDRDHIPTLFLYSKADKLVADGNIENFIGDRRKKCPKLFIRTVVYEDADHVMIYQKYPLDYLKHIKQHLSDCNLDFYNSKLVSKL